MKSAALTRAGRTRALAAAGMIAAASLALAGCSAEAPSAPSSDSSAPSSAVDSALAEKVAAFMEPADSLPVPTEPIDGVASLSGGTVFYIPITTQAPQFQVTGDALSTALETAGMKAQICSGDASPSTIASCVDQAINSGAKGIVADAIPYPMAANAFDAAQAAGIGVVISNQVAFDGHPASDTLTYINAPGVEMFDAVGAWIAQDSAGAANLLVNQSADGPATVSFATDGLEFFAADCPECTVAINEVSSGNYPLVPSSTSAALVSNPNIDYLLVQFAQYLQPSSQAVADAGATGRVKITTGASTLGALQAVQGGGVAAAAGQAGVFQGWAQADAAMRLALGAPTQEYVIPVRLFTAENIGDIALTAEAEASGEWFGPTDFAQQFAAIWGV